MISGLRLSFAAVERSGAQKMLVALAVVLLTAGSLKAYGIIVNGDRLLGSVALSVCAVAVEFGVAATLMVDRDRRRAWLVGFGFFTFLALVAWFEARTGRANCGCFGPLRVNPWFTLAFDLSAVTALVVLAPGPANRATSQECASSAELLASACRMIPRVRVALGSALVSLAAIAVMQGVVSARVPRDALILEPQEWLGQQVPILNEIDHGDEL